MFTMGRFDPRKEEKLAQPMKVPTFSKRKRKSGKGAIAELQRIKTEETLHKEGNGGNLRKRTRWGPRLENFDGMNEVMEIHRNRSDSSSVPSSDSSSSVPSSDSSSSVPSDDSSDEDSVNEREVSETEDMPNVQVIAPEQKSSSLLKRERVKLNSEGIDDFDTDQHTPESQSYMEAEHKIAFEMSRLPIRNAAKLWNLAPFLVENLEEDEYQHFFPIQALVIPDVIATERHAHIRNRDICVSAPTGSGKTLSFVLPVLNSLANRKVRRLRALVVLPSRDLATQVFRVFDRYRKGSNLKIGLAIGQTDFQVEQQNLLIGLRSRQKPLQKDSILQLSRAHDISKLRYNLQPLGSNALKAFCDIDQGLYRETNVNDALHGGESAIDVLVCTPGRLMDHLKITSGFTLQHLRFLIIDEADRLVNQSYQNWIQSVIDATFSGPQGMKNKNNGTESTGPFLKLDPVTWRRSNRDKDIDGINNVDHSVCRPVQLRKFLFSATLTKDPQKLAALSLVNPKHFDAHHLRDISIPRNSTGVIPSPNQSQMTYSLPIGLSEHTVECDAKQKPLVLLALLLEQGLIDKENGIDNGIVVVFTSSIDSTHRLTRLLQLLWGRAGYGPTSSIREFSSALSQKQRANLVEKCNAHGSKEESKRIQVVVCSDGMSRGMDISSVTAVINYDIPSFAKTYVHRCGRTARAGRSGRAISVMKTGQVGMFTKMRQLIVQPDRVEKVGVKKNLVNDATTMKVYKQCVRILKKVLEAEERDDLNPSSPLTEDWMKT